MNITTTDTKALGEALSRMTAEEGRDAVAMLEREVLYSNADPRINRAIKKLTAIRGLGEFGALRLLAAIGRLDWEAA